MFDAHNHNHTGRVGLWKIDVTPLVYLQLLDKLHSGRKVTYNETELQFAFKSYLTKTKGPWKKDDLKDLTGLTKVADDYVEKQKEKFEELQKKDAARDQKSGKPKPVSKAREKETQLLQKLGLLPKDDKATQFAQQDNDLTSDQQSAKLFRGAERSESMISLLSTIGEPTTTVAASLIVIAMQSELTEKICDLLLDTYKDDAKNGEEKDVILTALDKVMGPDIRLKLNPKISKIRAEEPDAGYWVKLDKLKLIEAEHQRKHEFIQNKYITDRTKAPVYTTPATTAKQDHTNNPYYIALPTLNNLNKAPAPPVIVSESTKRERD